MAKQKAYLLFPWGLMSIITILILSIFISEWVGKNWNWIVLILIIPVSILENLKTGYSSIKVMFRKIVYSMLSFLVVGLSLGAWLYNKYLVVQEDYRSDIDFDIHWFVFLGIAIVLIIEIVNVFSLLKAALREIGTLN